MRSNVSNIVASITSEAARRGISSSVVCYPIKLLQYEYMQAAAANSRTAFRYIASICVSHLDPM